MLPAIILGLVQGLTEFLPVSSSGHLVLIHRLFGFAAIGPAFDVFVQGGTVLSLLVYFAPRSKNLHLTPRYLGYLALGCLPSAVAGVLLAPQIEPLFSWLRGLSLGFFLTSLFLLATRYVKRPPRPLTANSSFLIGLAQAAAILPSLSRSGATIATSLLLGIRGIEAFNFSFLMSIPVLAGASLLSARHLVWDASLTPLYLTGFFVAALSGYFSLVLLDKVMLKQKFYQFAPYTLALALLALFL